MIKFSPLKTGIITLLIAGITILYLSFKRERPSEVIIKSSQKGYSLLVNGKPFYVKGFVGWSHFSEAQIAGANAVRIRANESMADSAYKYGFRTLIDLPVFGERDGMDWNNDSLILSQTTKVLAAVKKLKDHPAVLFWALGNELDWIPPGKPYSSQLWSTLNSITEKIHKLDPHHPVITVIGDSDFENKIRQINQDYPNLDLIGLNGYGNLERMMLLCAKNLKKPVVVTEWGVTGYWETPKTSWGAALEENSTQKAKMYSDRYTKVISKDPSRCLGSWVFLWGRKQEITHTWFNLFDQNGYSSQGVDVMQYNWTNKWPGNRAPIIDSVNIDAAQSNNELKLESGVSYEAFVMAHDFDKDSLLYAWEIKPEVKPGFYAGSGEIPAVPMHGLIADSTLNRIRFLAPHAQGPYRIFIYVYDGNRHFATANIPFLSVTKIK